MNMFTQTLCALVAALLFPLTAFAWTGPTQTAPNGNVAAPINVGSVQQEKSGDIWAANLVSRNAIIGATVNANTLCLGPTGSQVCKTAWPTSTFNGPYVPIYAAWNSSGVGSGGAAIYNDNGTYKKLMIVGNNSGGGYREVGLWDNVTVNGTLYATQYCISASCITSWPSGGSLSGGVANKIPLWTSASTLGNSSLTSDGVGNISTGGRFAAAVVSANQSGLGGSATSQLSYFDMAGGRIAAGYSIYSYGTICTGNGSGDCSGSGGIVLGGQNNAASLWIANNGTFSSSGTMYVPLIYDYNNNSYFLNLDSSSNVNLIYANQFLYSSDRRLKKNIEPITNALQKVSSLEGVTYNWIDPKQSQSRQIGFVAQDVERVVPELVTTDASTSLKAIDYAKVGPLLVNAIKEQEEKIDAQQKQIDELRKEIELLKHQ